MMKGRRRLFGHLPPSFLFVLSSLPIFALFFFFFFIILNPNSNVNYPFGFGRIVVSSSSEHHGGNDPLPPPSPPPPPPPSPPPPASSPPPPPPPPPPHASIVSPRDGIAQCDLSKGRWVQDRNMSRYTSSSCNTIPDSKNCLKNGREDRDFLNWRWQPRRCTLPRFDSYRFLRVVTGKRMAFIGDSVARNQFESLLCLLSQAEMPMDVYKDSEDRVRTWFFPNSNFTLMIFWSQFLIRHEEMVINGSNSGIFNLHLDKVDDKWVTKLSQIDYAVISTSHWFFRKNYLYDHDILVGCVYCNEPNVTDLGLNYSIRMAVRRALRHINDCKGCNGMVTMLRTFSPAHFENGAWNNGGGCNRTRPYSQGEVDKSKSLERELRKLQVEELERARKEGEAEGSKFISLDVTEAMLMRPDGHPDAHWGNKWMKGYNDCVHWCLPGPIDVWNDFLMAAILN
ncbi:Xyloglucan O-acetyltransferase 4, variant 2 [Dionaea muscipula]